MGFDTLLLLDVHRDDHQRLRGSRSEVIDGRLGYAARFRIVNTVHGASIVHEYTGQADVVVAFPWRWKDHEFVVVELVVRECDQLGMPRSVVPPQHALLASER